MRAKYIYTYIQQNSQILVEACAPTILYISTSKMCCRICRTVMYGNFELQLRKCIATRLAMDTSDPLNDNAGNIVVMFGMNLIMHKVMAAAITLLVVYGYPISQGPFQMGR